MTNQNQGGSSSQGGTGGGQSGTGGTGGSTGGQGSTGHETGPGGSFGGQGGAGQTDSNQDDDTMERDRNMAEHPRPDTPESKVEHQADQPGVTTGGESQGNPGGDHQDANQERKAGASAFKGGQSERGYHGTGQLGDQKVGEQPNAASRD